jgi:hypothetical protein
MSSLKTLLAAALVAASSTVAFADATRVDNAHIYNLDKIAPAGQVAFSNFSTRSRFEVAERPAALVIEGRKVLDARAFTADTGRAGSDR